MLDPERNIRDLQYLFNIWPVAQEAYVESINSGGLEYRSGFRI